MNHPKLYSKLESNVTINAKFIEQYWHYLKWGKKSESILDAGIGDGKVTKNVIMCRLPNNIKEYIGLDISPKMLNFSEATIKHSKFNTCLMDICTKEISPQYQNRYDKVFAFFLLHMLGSKLE